MLLVLGRRMDQVRTCHQLIKFVITDSKRTEEEICNLWFSGLWCCVDIAYCLCLQPSKMLQIHTASQPRRPTSTTPLWEPQISYKKRGSMKKGEKGINPPFPEVMYSIWGGDISVIKVTSYCRLHDWGFIPGRGRDFSLHHHVQVALGLPQSTRYSVLYLQLGVRFKSDPPQIWFNACLNIVGTPSFGFPLLINE
jgi:hypothetical protein